MAGTDSVVVVPSVSSGVNIDNAQYTDASGTVVQRQRVDVPAAVWVSGDILETLIVELRLHSVLLAQMMGLTDSLDSMRDDLTTEFNIE